MAPYVPYAPPLPKPTKFIQYYFIEWLLVVKPHLSINPPFPLPVWLLVVTVPTINSSDCSASVHTYLISLEISDHTYSAVGTFIALGAHNQKKKKSAHRALSRMYVCMYVTHAHLRRVPQQYDTYRPNSHHSTIWTHWKFGRLMSMYTLICAVVFFLIYFRLVGIKMDSALIPSL